MELDSLDDRIRIRDAIQSGRIQEATALVNQLHPELLDNDRYLYFHLQVMQLTLMNLYFSFCKCIKVTLTHNIILATMKLFPSLLPFMTCFGHKRPSSGVSVMPKLFHCIECPLIHITCKCDISCLKYLML
jgi:hypothetical protein